MLTIAITSAMTIFHQVKHNYEYMAVCANSDSNAVTLLIMILTEGVLPRFTERRQSGQSGQSGTGGTGARYRKPRRAAGGPPAPQARPAPPKPHINDF